MRKMALLIGVLAGAALAASCTSRTLSYDDPRIADDGTYPNLNIAPAVATEPLGEAEAEATIRSVQAARPPDYRQPASEYEAQRLQRLAQTHGPETLRRIEASGN